MNPELHRPIELGRIHQDGTDITVDASTRECSALAIRMNLPAIHALTCRFHLRLDGKAVVARGHLTATIVQTCVVSLDDFEAAIEERFTVRFVPTGTESEDDDPGSIDEIPYEGHAIDLGEAAAEQLGLALDPYPRLPGAALPEGLEDEPRSPFAALRALRQKN
jgi:uncharacterized metal-binding protein YceD (DUF177 family)